MIFCVREPGCSGFTPRPSVYALSFSCWKLPELYTTFLFFQTLYHQTCSDNRLKQQRVCECQSLSRECQSLSLILATPRIVDRLSPLSMVFSRQEYQSGQRFPSLGDLPDPGIDLRSPTLQADSLLSEPPEKPQVVERPSLKSGPASSPSLPLSSVQFSSVAQSCPTLCDPIDGSPPGSPIPGILQARTLEWVAISFSNA